MTIIKIAKQAGGFHLTETQSHRTHNWLGEEYAIVPVELENQIAVSEGYCDITIEEQFETVVIGYNEADETEITEKQSIGMVVTSIILTEKPPVPEAEPSETELLSLALTGGF